MNDSTSSILLCPGQGAQHVGMGRSWYDASEAARQTFEAADAVLGTSLSQLCFAGPEDRLSRTDMAQAAIYTTSVACYRGLASSGGVGTLAATAGLSLGEFTALHLAGAFDFETGLKLVQLRGRAMQDAADASQGGMVALIGADEAQADTLCDQARGDGVLVPANFNCPGQIVISGDKAACDRSLGVAEKLGIRATALNVAGAFHSPLMQPAADRLAEALDAATWSPLQTPVLANVTGLPHASEPTEIKRRLVEQLTGPVRWSQSMVWMLANVSGTLRELAPGKVLSGLMRRIDRGAKVENHADPKSA